MEKYRKINVKYASDIKIGDLILFNNEYPLLICEVIKIEKGTRHSREDGYPYIFTGKKENILYKKKYWNDITKFVPMSYDKYPAKKPIIFTDGGDPWDLYIQGEYVDEWNFHYDNWNWHFKDYQKFPLNKNELLKIYNIEYSGFIIPPDDIAETESPFKSKDDVINYILDVSKN